MVTNWVYKEKNETCKHCGGNSAKWKACCDATRKERIRKNNWTAKHKKGVCGICGIKVDASRWKCDDCKKLYQQKYQKQQKTRINTRPKVLLCVECKKPSNGMYRCEDCKKKWLKKHRVHGYENFNEEWAEHG